MSWPDHDSASPRASDVPRMHLVPVGAATRADEPPTHRLSDDEVRSFSALFTPEPPPLVRARAGDGSEPELEPPTLLYRSAGKVRRPPPRAASVRQLREASHDEPANEAAPEPPRARPTLEPARPSGAQREAPVPAESGWAQHAALLVRRSRRLGLLVLALLATGTLVLSALGRAGPTLGAVTTSSGAGDCAPAVPPGQARAELGADEVKRVTSLVLSGERAGALEALRTFARAAPGSPSLRLAVRAVEQALATCAARGGEACR